MNKIMKMFNTAIFVLTITLAGITYADNVEIKLGSGDGFKVLDSSGSPLMDILSGGKVGIGTVSPSEKLEVSGNIKATKFIGDGSGLTDISSAWTTSDSDIYYNVGNVGIGTTAPSGLFHIKGTSGRMSFIEANDGGTAVLQMGNSDTGIGTTQGFIIGLDADESVLLWNYQDAPLRFGTNGTEKVRILNNGNVGIGTTSPAQKLDVNGRIRIRDQGAKVDSDCNPNTRGTIVYDGTFWGCTENDWVQLNN